MKTKIRLGKSVCGSVCNSVRNSVWGSPYSSVSSLVKYRAMAMGKAIDSYVYTSIWTPINNSTRWVQILS